MTAARNDPCPCGSGRKYKQCCLDKDEQAAREARARAAEQTPAAEPAEEAASASAPRRARPQSHQPWKAGSQNTRGFQKFSAPRKVGS